MDGYTPKGARPDEPAHYKRGLTTMKLRKMITLAAAGTAVASLSLFGVGITAAYAVDQPITFEVTAGSLAIAQTATAGTALTQATPANMPVTTVTDGRNSAARTGAWTVTGTASNLFAVNGAGTGDDATILAAQITLDESGSFTTLTGTPVDEAAVVGGPAALVSATGDAIDSVYSYTPTATLAAQTRPFSGSYTGSVTQTVA
jgi:hypothetical protein